MDKTRSASLVIDTPPIVPPEGTRALAGHVRLKPDSTAYELRVKGEDDVDRLEIQRADVEGEPIDVKTNEEGGGRHLSLLFVKDTASIEVHVSGPSAEAATFVRGRISDRYLEQVAVRSLPLLVEAVQPTTQVTTAKSVCQVCRLA